MHPREKEEKMLGIVGGVGSFDVAKADLWVTLSFKGDSSYFYHRYFCNYVVTDQMMHV